MTNINRYAATLADLSHDEIALISSMIKQGYGAQGIKCETPFSLKQVNAVFALVSTEAATDDFNYVGSRHHY